MNSAEPTVDQVIYRFRERSEEGMPGIAALRSCNTPFPDNLLARLYDRIDTCPEAELPIIEQAFQSSTVTALSALTAYLDNFDFAVQIVEAQTSGMQEAMNYAPALRDLVSSFTRVGLDSVLDFDLKQEHSDLLCAHLLLTGVNIVKKHFLITHEYHMELELIKADLGFLRESPNEFFAAKWAMPFKTRVADILPVAHYMREKGAVNKERIKSLLEQRGGFDREVFDLIINSEARAVSEGTL